MDLGGEMGDMPITLIVKAPNQRIADQNVECTLGWTIRKLKEHLQHVYPNKPKHNQQKLIYSGKLLEDNLTLKQVLRQDDDNIHHTVHLVCSALHDTIIEDTQNVDKSSPSSRSVPPTTDSTSSTDGLRYRGTSLPQHNHWSRQQMPNAYPNYMQQMFNQTPQMYGTMPQMYGTMPQMYGAMPPMYNAMPAGYSQEQYNMMMQQMYSQYMNQYMHYYNSTMGVTPPPSPATPVVQEEVINRNEGGNDRPVNQNIRMNAQGGIVEDDDENEQRDWLDCIYMLFRIMVLFSIVYFYSTIARSIAVFLAFLLIYVLQKGWLLIRRRERENAAAPPPAPEAVPQPAPEPTSPNDNDNGESGESQIAQGSQDNPDGVAAEESTESNTAETTLQPQAPADPGFIATAWCFFSTFFSSLIPEQPAAVNQN